MATDIWSTEENRRDCERHSENTNGERRRKEKTIGDMTSH
jgi:hypothetical protein